MPVSKLDTRHIANHALKAIAKRLLYPAPYALLGIERDGSDVIVRLNSGGNVLAVESYLRRRGYQASYDGSNPGGYGGAVRVRPAPKASAPYLNEETPDDN